MEKDFYTDDFEQLLKDTTADFRMYPSRKVWHSIYNDLHPARKWPSFAVCLLLITSILYIGIHNNNNINADAGNILFSSLSPSGHEVQNSSAVVLPGTNQEKKLSTTNSPQLRISQKTNLPYSVTNSSSLGRIMSVTEPDININGMTLIPGDFSTIPAPTFAPLVQDKTEELTIYTAPIIGDPYETKPGNKLNELFHGAVKPVTDNTAAGNQISESSDTRNSDPADTKNLGDKSEHSPVVRSRNTEETAWIEDYAFHNKRNSNKWKTKLSTITYFTPSVGYRILNKNNHFEPANALLIRNSATPLDADNSINNQAALNMESGASVLLDLNKRLRIKGGVQFNYTNYISFAQKLSHPTQTNVLLNDLYSGNTMLVPYSTMYGNKPGANLARLNNKTIQFSLPIGADYKLMGNEKIKWYVGATMQPTYVAGGNAYLVSADYKNYIDVPSMLRKWNLNTGVESFISYKTKNGSSINLGPQFRYQLLSTYSKQYTYSERLYNIGIKLGIMRKL